MNNGSANRRAVLGSIGVGFLATSLLSGCGGGGDTSSGDASDTSTNTSDGGNSSASDEDVTYSDLTSTAGWTPETHGELTASAIAANLTKVFDTSQIQRLDIVIESANWQVMQNNLARLTKQLGGSSDFSSLDDPVTVPCEVFYNGVQWFKVGIRYKGNSSLYSADSYKLPFKLNFEKFSDEYQAITGQRFYGFKNLHLKSNFRDPSELREVLAADLFRSWGVACSHASFYELYLDTGSGAEYYGVYTLVEDVEDTVIQTQYGNAEGNLYKPEEGAAHFSAGSWSTDELGLKTNEDGATYADALSLYNAINDTATFAADASTWRVNLEASFDVTRFLKWLAANTVMQNWDTYGVMPHNFYLYADADNSGRLSWIPWDNNEALNSNTQAIPLSLAGVDATWPLIFYIAQDTKYFSTYKAYVGEFASEVFSTAAVQSVIDSHVSKIANSVVNERSGYTYTSSSEFSEAVQALKSHVATRYAAAMAFANS